MALIICWNRARGTMTSAIWNLIALPWGTIFAPIFTNRSRNVVIDQWLTASTGSGCGVKLARLKGQGMEVCSRTAFAAKRRQDRRVQVIAFLPLFDVRCSAVPR